MKVQKFGLCIVSDKYFRDFPHPRHMDNKSESRPHYLAMEATNGIIWLIPLSSQVEKYREKITRGEEKYGKGNHIFHYITRLRGQEKVFLIGNAIPVTDQYIIRPFTISKVPFVIGDEKDRKALQSKLSQYLAMVRGGRFRSEVDILSIENQLLNRMENERFML